MKAGCANRRRASERLADTEVEAAAQLTRATVDWDEVRARTEHWPFAKAFFTLVAELEIAPVR